MLTCIVTPNPFDRMFTIQVMGGDPPYHFSPAPSPPNPPGVTVDQNNPATVMVTPQPPPGTPVTIHVTDSGTPPQSAQARSRAQ